MKIKKIMSGLLTLFIAVGALSLVGSVNLATATSAEPPQDTDKEVAQPKSKPADAPKEMSADSNPLFHVWKGLKGKTLTFNRKTWISGGAPPGDKRLASEITVAYKVSEITAEKVTIEATENGGAKKPVFVQASITAKSKAMPTLQGEEEIEIGKEKKKCKVYQYQRLEGTVPATVRVWVADAGIVKTTVSYTVRASYLIEETIAAP